MHLAVAEGPNHSPGCFPHAFAPCSTNLCIENGALGSSANNDNILRSSSRFCPLRQSLPSCSITREFASKLCPDRIMHPHPESDVKPPWFPSCFSRTEKLKLATAFGDSDFCIDEKFERYVSQILLSKSSRNALGHPASASPAAVSSAPLLLRLLLLSVVEEPCEAESGAPFGALGDDVYGSLPAVWLRAS